MLPRSREWKHYFSLWHLNINLCDLFISPDVPVQSRLHQLPNRVAALFSPRRSSSELLFSHFRKKKTSGGDVTALGWCFSSRGKKKSFLPILRVRAAAAVAAAAPRGAEQMFFFCGTSTSCLGCLGRYSALPSYWELSVIIIKCSIWLISSCVQPFLFLPFTWEMTPSMLASHIQYVAVYDKLIYKQFIDT